MTLITTDITMDSVRLLCPNLGLSQREAEKCLQQVGPNDPSPRKRGALLMESLVLFLNPLVIILLVAVVISIVVAQVTDAAIIFVIAMLSVVSNFIRTYRSERSARRLREHVSLTTSVLRDGNWQELRRETVVPGDLVRLSAGDLVPADGFLLESRDLYVQQAALTGESMPAEKHMSSTTGEPSPEIPNWVFLETSVVSGTAIVRVTATGTRTSFGFMGAKLRERTGDTEFERGLKQFGMLIMRAVLFLVLFILVIRTARNPLKSRPSIWLTVNALAVVAVGLALPWPPLAGFLGFKALPLPFFLFLGISTITYLVLVEAAKHKVLAVSRHRETSLAEAAT